MKLDFWCVAETGTKMFRGLPGYFRISTKNPVAQWQRSGKVATQTTRTPEQALTSKISTIIQTRGFLKKLKIYIRRKISLFSMW